MTGFAAPDGTRLSYEELGTGPPLVCWPGGPGRSCAYLEDLGGLTADRTLVLLDPRATGRSELPADPATLGFDRLAEDLEALRVHLGQSQLQVLAHSAGTLVAQAWASAFPDRVGALVLVTPSGRLQGSAHEDLADLVASRSGEAWYPEAREAFDALGDAPPAARAALMRAVRPFMYARWDARCQEHAASADSQTNRRAELGFRAETVDAAA
ncbi:MAG: alpha/beta hydrolase, partial [Actinomycetota bacterium]|nr:alpha/beta hydrolase [Actinomycetota bacterium]